jgi:hypothetical protein
MADPGLPRHEERQKVLRDGEATDGTEVSRGSTEQQQLP